MIRVNVKLDIAQMKRHMKGLEKKVDRAAVRALNRVADNVKSEAVRRMRAHRGLKASTIREAIQIKRAGLTSLVAEVIASGQPIPLREYGARQTRRGVSVLVNPTRGRKLIMSHGNRAFEIAKFGRHVFVRSGRQRLPIQKLFGPSIPATFLRRQVIAAMRDVIAKQWPQRFAHEMKRELARAAA